MWPFRRLGGLYVFCCLQLVGPLFGLAAALLLLHGRRGHSGAHRGAPSRAASDAASDANADVWRLLHSKHMLLSLLAINTLLVGVTAIGMPVTAAGERGRHNASDDNSPAGRAR